jgi:hypothetical protein
VAPLAHDRYLRIEPIPVLGVAADLAVVLALLGDPRVQDAVVCTHGEVIGQVLVRLVVDGLAVDQPLAWPKGSTWLLDDADGRFRFGRYLPPLPLADALTRHRHHGGCRPMGLPSQGPGGVGRRPRLTLWAALTGPGRMSVWEGPEVRRGALVTPCRRGPSEADGCSVAWAGQPPVSAGRWCSIETTLLSVPLT